MLKKSTPVLLILILSLLLGACSPAAVEAPVAEEPAAEAEEPAAEEEAAEPAPEEEQVELTLWMHQNPAFIAANEELIKRFEAENPNVTIKLESFDWPVFVQTLKTAIPSGTEADIIEMFGTWVCDYGDQLAEVPQDVMTYEEAQSQFFAATLDGYYCDGKLYGLPNEFNIENGGVLVNQAMYESAGMEWPPRWATIDDMIADAETLTQVNDGMMDVAGFHFISTDAMGFHLLAGILQRGGEYMLPDGSGVQLVTPEARETVEQMKAWVDQGVTDPFLFNAESNWVGDSFFAGQAGIGFIGPWIVPIGVEEYPDVQFEYLGMPPYAGDTHYFAADAGWGKVVSPNSEHQDIAFEFVKFATANAENAKMWNITTGTVPALVSLAADPALLEEMPYLAPSLDILEFGRFVGPIPDKSRFKEIAYNHLMAVFQGSETVDEALTGIEQETNALFE